MTKQRVIKNERGPAGGPPEVVEVGDRVYAYIQPDGSWLINNTGFIVGNSSVICVDACATEKRTRAFREQIAGVTSSPVTALVNTHDHGDHTYGNSLLGAPTIIGHENSRDAVLAAGLPANNPLMDPVDFGDLTVSPPTLTFRDCLQLWSDDRLIEVRAAGKRAHTDSDVLVWLPEERVLFCGDLLFNQATPFLLMGSVPGLIDVLQEVVASYPAEVIVPGHGPLCHVDLIPTTVKYLDFVLTTARAGLDSGLSPLEAAREADLGEFAEWLDNERIVGNLHSAYSELDSKRGEVDVMTAITDMVAYRGGPLASFA